jgi:tetratricopeptide (TPR) repeat protein
MILYRPVGLQELELIYDSGMKVFPARLSQQPIFYPVLNLEYARQVASDWNVKSGQFAGYVTQFKLEDDYASQFEKHTVGGSQHQELWIPAEEVEEFNKHIIGHIKVVEAHFSDAYQGFIPDKFALQGKNAVEQFTLLANSYLYKRMDFYLEIKRNHKAVFLNYPFWQKYGFKNQGLKEKVLQAIREAWLTSFPKIPLVNPVQDNMTLVKQTDSPSVVNEVEEDATPVKQPNSRSRANPIDNDVTHVKQTHSHPFVSPGHEDVKPIQQAESNSLVNPVHGDPSPVKPMASQSLVRPVRKDSMPIEQTDAPAYFSQGLELASSGKYREAIDELSKAIEKNPDQLVARTSLGIAFHRLGEDDRALSCYEAALKIDPKHAESHYFSANILYSHGNVREAITEYIIAIGLEPALIEAHQKPVPQDRLTDYSPAPAEMYWIAKPAHRILDLNKLLESNPGQAYIFKERAAEYYRLWNYEQTITDYSSSLAIQPDDADVLHFRGLAYEQIGQFDRALEDYQQAIKINPRLSGVYINRGVTLGKMGNFRQSVSSLTEGIRLAPKNPDGYFNRGMSYFQQGDLERAIEDFSVVIDLSSNDEAAYYWRGISNEEAGRQSDAISDYTHFLALSQDVNAKEEIERKLNQWNVGKPERTSNRSTGLDARQKTNPVQSDRTNPDLDLYVLIAALGERALNSTWFGSGVDCYGERAEELYAFTDQNKPIEGHDLLQITSGIRQTIQGDFQAFDPDATSHWILIRAWEGSGFYVEANDAKIMKQLKTHFQAAEDVEGAYTPFEGLFIRT